ncbi:hypothetical protein E2C01_039549 [Portunus trituberculatus]|uniref:Uncharacterized protein n=1 Tax=Portunus trituberculatus TaxID=210409 RepID=A0A5B7FKZ3_PORTR|nr:hypothetical protein [Portunus trituberculatus]
MRQQRKVGGVREATEFFITRREERQPIAEQRAVDPSCKRYGEKMRGRTQETGMEIDNDRYMHRVCNKKRRKKIFRRCLSGSRWLLSRVPCLPHSRPTRRLPSAV